LLFVGTYIIYKSVYSQPRNWYDHYLYLARAFVSLRVDVSNLPDYFQDKIIINGKTLLPFPPLPGVILIPFILLFKAVTQQQVSILLGSVNVFLAYILLKKFAGQRNAILLSIFLSVGTVYFWAAVVGTTWYFAHVVATTFLLLSLISHFNKKDFLAGILFALAGLSRYPIVFGGIFFLFELISEKRRLFNFLAGAAIFIPIQLGYDWLRFGSLFDTGYLEVYKNYINSSYPYTILQLFNSATPYFGYMDLRNVPLHLFTFLVFPPIISPNLVVSPSPYGMGILFTTPLLLLGLWPHFKVKLERNLFFGGASIALIDFLHYMQGWVQFGYRFLLDFLPFVLILLAIKFKLNKKTILLLLISVIVNFWGVTQAVKLGW
jgi:hypothetical protein